MPLLESGEVMVKMTMQTGFARYTLLLVLIHGYC